MLQQVSTLLHTKCLEQNPIISSQLFYHHIKFHVDPVNLFGAIVHKSFFCCFGLLEFNFMGETTDIIIQLRIAHLRLVFCFHLLPTDERYKQEEQAMWDSEASLGSLEDY